jgi:hypothetical protein
LEEIVDVAKQAFCQEKFEVVSNFLNIVEGLKVLRCAPVERQSANFRQYMNSQLQAYASDLENLAKVLKVGAALPVLAGEVKAVARAMEERIEANQIREEEMKEKDRNLKVAKKDNEQKDLANAALQTENVTVKASAAAKESEAAVLRSTTEDLGRQLRTSEARLKEEQERPRPQSGGGGGGGDMGMGMLAMMMNMMGGMGGGGGGSGGVGRRSSSSGGGTTYRGVGRPRNSDYTSSGDIRR